MYTHPRELPHDLLQRMRILREDVYQEGERLYKRWEQNITRDFFEGSARNLAYYIALRTHDLRDYQEEFSSWGLSSLGRLESRTIASIDAVIATLEALCGEKRSIHPPLADFGAGHRQLELNAIELFGEIPGNRRTSIMVTVDETAADPAFVEELVAGGVNVLRINCAHDGPELWKKIIDNARAAEEKLKRPCRVAMDIAGPKARTSWVMCSSRNERLTEGTRYILSREEGASIRSDDILQAGCSLPQILDDVLIGDPILMDDGSIEGVVIEQLPEGVLVEVTKTDRPRGKRLRVDRGLNFPETELEMSFITEKDKMDLDFACRYADIIGFSFIRTAEDIEYGLEEIAKRIPKKKHRPGVIAKIETLKGIDNLAEIIASAAGRTPFGVMIARGDLAVETGYMRLAELQQQILWICEAADVPSIWATTVLDNLVRQGIPTRTEMTDAAEGGARAECVMLNKGEHILEAVHFLEELLDRMDENVYKKTPLLRPLNIAKKVSSEADS